MTQQQLDDMWIKCIEDKPANWAGVDHGDIHTLRLVQPDTLWARKAPKGEWKELP